MNIFKIFKQKPIQEKHMDMFSQEYLDKLIAEHKLVNASVMQIQQNYLYYKRFCTVTIIEMELNDLLKKKFSLEVQIDVLNEFLKG